MKRIICILLLALFSCGCAKNTPAKNTPTANTPTINTPATNHYQLIKSTNLVAISYDTTSVKYYSTGNKKVDVWILSEYTKEGAKNYLEGQRAIGFCKKAKWDNFSYNLDHELLSKNSYKFLESVYYDVNGNVIYSIPYENTKSYNIKPGSWGEEIHNKFSSFLDS